MNFAGINIFDRLPLSSGALMQGQVRIGCAGFSSVEMLHARTDQPSTAMLIPRSWVLCSFLILAPVAGCRTGAGRGESGSPGLPGIRHLSLSRTRLNSRHGYTSYAVF